MHSDSMANQMAYLKIVYTFSAIAHASNHSYRLPLRRCSNNSRLVASSNLETLHRSFTTFTIRIVLKISTNDRVDCRSSCTGLYFRKPSIGRYVGSTEDPMISGLHRSTISRTCGCTNSADKVDLTRTRLVHEHQSTKGLNASERFTAVRVAF